MTADIIIGAISLASLLSLFETCNRAYDVFIRSARNIGRDAYLLGVRLEVERGKLRLWGRYLGISRSQECRLLRKESLETQDLVVKLLECIKTILDDIDVITVRYGVRIYEAGQDPATVIDAGLRDLNLDDIRNCAAVKVAQFKREKSERSIVASTSRLGKLRWALTDNDRLSKLVDDLCKINKELWVSLPVNQWLKLAKGLPSYVLPAISDQEMLSDVEARAKDSETTKLLAECSTLRRVALVAAANESKDLFAEELRLKSKNVKILMGKRSDDPKRPSPQRHLACVVDNPEDVTLLEWRYVDGAFRYADQKPIRSRIKSLAYVLSSGKSSQFGLLKCVGFYKDEEHQDQTSVERYGLLFNLPAATSQLLLHPNPTSMALEPNLAHLLPRTLGEHITGTIKSNSRPTLTDRFHIATALCHTVLQIHAAGWLHKAIQSNNILLCVTPKPNDSTSSTLDLANPFLLGFDFSRPDRPDALSLDLPKDRTSYDYYHPSLWPPATADVMPTNPVRFKQKYDIYALGVVLLEVGTWSLVSSISVTRDLRQPWAWRKTLLERAKVLGYLCGSVYQQVVETCLEGNFAEGDSTPAEEELDAWQSRAEEAPEGVNNGHEGYSVKHSFLFDIMYKLVRCYA